MTAPDYPARCSAISLNRHEPLIGTAPRADVWLLLTYSGALSERAFEESDLPGPVKQHLESALERIPHARLQLISPAPEQDKIELIVASGREIDPLYRRFDLESYEELVDLDIDLILNSSSESANRKLREPLYLVCTNGRRDPCCAQHGLPVFQALHSSLGDRVRQSSHVGGHRFAANVVQLPYGLCYGRIRPEHVAELLDAGRQGRMLLDRLRGRACYPRHIQAAEILLRKEVGADTLEHYRLRDHEQIADDRWRVAFEDPSSGTLHRLELESVTSGERDRVSCWSDKLSSVTRYQLRLHAVSE